MNVCVPPQEEVTVSVPTVGGFVKLIVPDSEYWLLKQILGTAESDEIAQTQAFGAA